MGHFVKASINLPCEPQSGKTQTPEGTWLGKGMKNSELGKTSRLYTPLHHTQLLSEAKQHRGRGSRRNTPSPLPERSGKETSLSAGFLVGNSCMATLTHKLLPPHWGGSLLTHEILLVLAMLAQSLQVNEEHDITDKNMY